MKRLLLTLLLFGATMAGKAQEVYNYVLENATRVVNSPTSSFTQTRIAQFKRTALIYMNSKSENATRTLTVDDLNNQAYYLSEFITLFFSEYLKASKAGEIQRKETVKIFMGSSLNNPLFNDPDTETTQSYIQEGSELTPFSLDTDWQKAYVSATVLLKEIKK